jgi:hypothetical protein
MFAFVIGLILKLAVAFAMMPIPLPQYNGHVCTKCIPGTGRDGKLGQHNGVNIVRHQPQVGIGKEGGYGLDNGVTITPDPMVYVIMGESCAKTGEREARDNGLKIVGFCKPD